jgi:hypothetical protein
MEGLAGMLRAAVGSLLALTLCGCASVSTKLTGSPRAGAEQALLTGTADRAIDCIDFRPLAGAAVFLDASHVSASDSGWILFALRRTMARQGVRLVDAKKDAAVIVEAAVGAYGTDEVDCRLSVPGALPAVGPLPLLPLGTERALIRKNRQDAVVKLALTGFDAKMHHLIWESGTILGSQSLDRRFFGMTEITRRSSLPELEDYPRRKGF